MVRNLNLTSFFILKYDIKLSDTFRSNQMNNVKMFWSEGKKWFYCLQEDTMEETGWKLVHGDVFRPPKRAWLLTAFVGSGVQIFFMVLITLGKIILKEFVNGSMMFLWEIVVKLKSAESYRWHRVNFHCVVSGCSVCHAWNVVTCQQRKPYDSNHISLCLHGVSVSIKSCWVVIKIFLLIWKY